MFDREEGQVRVKPQFREGVTWRLGDARDAGLVGALGLQDIMVANWFLCTRGGRRVLAQSRAVGQARRVPLCLRCRPRRAEQSRSGARLETGDGADRQNPRGRSIVTT